MASLPSGGTAGLPTGLLRSAVDDDTLESMTQQLLQVSTVFLMQQNELQEVKERLQKELQRVTQIQEALTEAAASHQEAVLTMIQNYENLATELPPATFPSLADGLPTEEAAPPADAAPAAEAAPPPPIALDIEVPDAVKAAVEEQIATQVAAMRAALEAQYAEKNAGLENKLAALEAK